MKCCDDQSSLAEVWDWILAKQTPIRAVIQNIFRTSAQIFSRLAPDVRSARICFRCSGMQSLYPLNIAAASQHQGELWSVLELKRIIFMLTHCRSWTIYIIMEHRQYCLSSGQWPTLLSFNNVWWISKNNIHIVNIIKPKIWNSNKIDKKHYNYKVLLLCISCCVVQCNDVASVMTWKWYQLYYYFRYSDKYIASSPWSPVTGSGSGCASIASP